ncbi:hypothetical protein FCL74_04125, partial [Mycoplasma bovis]|nr:hypothetical protein [Mycoplasmopsis bovis]
SIPFVAAKCGETKEEEKKKPEEGKNPGQNTDPGKNPGQNTDPGKNPGGDKNPETDKKPEEEKKPEADKPSDKPADKPGGDKNPETDKKPEEEKKPEADKPSDKPADKPGGDKNPETDTTPAKPTKIDISKLETNIQNELKNLAKKDVLSEDIIDVLKKVKGLESIRLGDLSKVEFNEEDKKLTIEAHRDSKLITGKYELTAQPGKPGATTQPSGAVQPGK